MKFFPSLSSTPLFIVLSFAMLGLPQTAARNYTRDDFPSEFVFGAGTSAYQYEGAVSEDGRTPSIWDTFTHAGNMKDKSTGDVAADGYHKFKEDVKLMSDTRLEAYRFSIAWARLLPNGRGAINPKGLKYYNDVINELVDHGIQPHITLYHLDLPQVIEDEYGGWLSPKIIGDFKEYADVCFREFSDRVSHWTTIVEPNVIGQASYDSGVFPPQRCSYPFGNCLPGNSTVEPYIAVHNTVLAHAAVVDLYRTKYQLLLNSNLCITHGRVRASPAACLLLDERISNTENQKIYKLAFNSIIKILYTFVPIWLSHLMHFLFSQLLSKECRYCKFQASRSCFCPCINARLRSSSSSQCHWPSALMLPTTRN